MGHCKFAERQHLLLEPRLSFQHGLGAGWRHQLGAVSAEAVTAPRSVFRFQGTLVGSLVKGGKVELAVS